MDTVGLLTKSTKGNRYALTVQCDLTKYIITVPIADKQASTLAKALVENLILIYGCTHNSQFVNEQHDDWDSWIPFFTFFYNTTPHTEHTFTPFELVFGTQANYPARLKETNSIDPVYNYDAYQKELKFKLQLAAHKARILLEKSKINRICNQTQKANPTDVQIGDQIWLKKENRRKLDSGPFTIIQMQHPNVTIQNTISKETQTVHKNRIVK